MKTIRQILAIARTEFRFGLRRGAPVVVTALVGLILGAAILLDPLANISNSPRYEEIAPDARTGLAEIGITESVFQSLNRDSLADLTASSTPVAWIFLSLGLLLLPIATAGAIPADRQHGVFELLRSTPVRGGTYLAGKVLGSVGITLFVAAFPLLLFLAVLEGILLGVYQYGIPVELLKFYAALALLDGIPLLVCGAAIGVFAGVFVRSRKGSIVPGLVAGIAAAAAWTRGLRVPGVRSNSADLAANFVFQQYRSLFQASWKRYNPDIPPFDLSLLGAEAPVIRFGQVLLMYALVLAVLAGLAALARLWLRMKENF